MKPDRKTFLSGLAVAALAPAAASAAGATPAAPAPPAAPQDFPFHFDHARFDRMTNVAARYRHVVAATKLNEGRVIDVVETIFGSYTQDVGVPASDLVVASVLYHGTPVVLALDDAAWKTYVQPAIFQIARDEIRDDLASLRPQGKGNPADDDYAQMRDERTPLFVCRWAFGGMATMIANALKRPKDAVYSALAASLLPKAMLVPSGVWAIAELQHRGFSYQQATL